MRITGGAYCGRTIEVPDSSMEIRPAMDRMRESVFAILGDLSGLSFLDLFSGSGIIALEAASRGAHPVVCVERDRVKFPTLLKNVSIAERHIECKAQPVELFLSRNKERFDLVFLDPPFPYLYRLDLLKVLSKKESLVPGGLLLIHFPREDRLSDRIDRLILEDERRYGRSHVRFYRKTKTEESQ
ncbi:MAG: 16S rRNA (guanine(966)-N(2))-methyltransferase RsmD [Spirochaetia bacterium]|jgi:16S rRNA (guanine(966)-N(2))-methyltransferase RsmD|nr:16S rRNA (guanine(966)-N(2))-methyltransferase RsmD [Spirochaetia bacterium]